MFNLAKLSIGHMLYDTDHLWIGNVLHEHGEYSPDEVVLMRSLIKPGFHVIEGGSNIGCLTVPIANAVGADGRVMAFESQPQTAALLRANVVMNGLSERVEVIESFLGNVSDNGVSVDVPIYAIGEPRNVGGITSIPKGHKEIKTVNVNIEDIDYMVYVNQWDRVDLIKLDVEGNELAALRGAEKTIKEYRPILYLENNTCDIPPDDNNPDGRKSDPNGLIEYLVSLDYVCYWHHPSIFTGSDVVSHNMLCFHKDDERLSGSDAIVFMR